MTTHVLDVRDTRPVKALAKSAPDSSALLVQAKDRHGGSMTVRRFAVEDINTSAEGLQSRVPLDAVNGFAA